MSGASLLMAVVDALSTLDDVMVGVRRTLGVIAQSVAARDVILISPSKELWGDRLVLSGTEQVDAEALRQLLGTKPAEGLLGSRQEPVFVIHVRHGGQRLATLAICLDPDRELSGDQLFADLTPACKVLSIALAQASTRRRLSASERNYREVVEGVKSIILRFDASGTIHFINEFGARFFGFASDELLGRNVMGTVVRRPDEAEAAMSKLMADVRANPDKYLFSEMQHRRADGSTAWVSWSNHAVLDPRGYLVEILSVGHDITRRKELEHELLRLATTDPLTSAANRRRFLDLLTREARRAGRHERPMSLLMLDIDHFKRINDTHGHDMGDRVLVQLVACCRKELRDTDAVGRLGGEEFALLLPETPLEAAGRVADRLRRALAALSTAVPFTVSLGVAEMRAGETTAALIKRADKALYRAKHGGRDQVVVDSHPAGPPA